MTLNQIGNFTRYSPDRGAKMNADSMGEFVRLSDLEPAAVEAPPDAAPERPVLFTWIEHYLCERQKAGDVKARGLWEQWCDFLDARPAPVAVSPPLAMEER